MVRELPVEIGFGHVIPYIAMTENYGRAEFELCPVFKYGKMTDLYIDRRQQVDREWYHINLKQYGANHVTGMWFSTYGQATQHFTDIWQTVWCEEHKCHAMELYVVLGTSKLEVGISFGTQIHLQFS